MSGKVSYTMKEMKLIVDYLTEHKAYSELKGKKMWMDFANSKLTNRTWQSLKECFLKRILPDIHNPYFKLSREQVRSFRECRDLEINENMKLEIKTATDQTSSDGKEINKSQPSTNNLEEKTSGEDISCSKILTRNRSSVDTLVLENVNEKDKEADCPNKKSEETNGKPPTETTTNVMSQSLLNVLQDFGSDSDSEPPLQIADNGINEIANQDVPNSNSKTENEDVQQKNKPINGEVSGKCDPNDEMVEVIEIIDSGDTQNVVESSIPKNSPKKDDNSKKDEPTNSLTNTNTTADTVLPNNQEGFENSRKDDIGTQLDEIFKDTTKENVSEQPQKIAQKRPSKDSTKSNLSLKKKKKLNTISKNEDLTAKTSAEENSTEKTISTVNYVNSATTAQTSKIVESKDGDTEMNPCLQSVSLYEEQFSLTKYTDCESDETDKIPASTEVVQPHSSKEPISQSNVVVLHSHSDSSTSKSEKETRNRHEKKKVKIQKDSALSNLFGFSKGKVIKNKHRTKIRSASSYFEHQSDESSGWSTDSEGEYVSPPRGRKGRSKKYLKPKSHRVISLEEEGGLFVMIGKKIYPVVKDGRIMKNYLTYTSDGESDSEQAMWKEKYLEEKRKIQELTKFNKQLQAMVNNRDSSSKVTQVGNEELKTIYRRSNMGQESAASESSKALLDQAKTVKIMVTNKRNNAEMHLEGASSTFGPIAQQLLLQMFNEEKEAPNGVEKNHLERPASSGKSTPISTAFDTDLKENVSKMEELVVKEKVSKMEEEIFNEIEKNDREENSKSEAENVTNVTKRKRELKPKKSVSLPTSPRTPSRRAKEDKKTSVQDIKEIEPVTENVKPVAPMKRSPRGAKAKMAGDDESNNIPSTSLTTLTKQGNKTSKENVTRKRTRSAKNIINENVDKAEESKTVQKKSKLNDDSQIIEGTEDNEIRYRFPSPAPAEPARVRRSNSKITTNVSKSKIRYSTSKAEPTNVSIDSTQGYQDSDISPIKTIQKRKRKLSLSTALTRISKRTFSRKSNPVLTEEFSSDSNSSNSMFAIPRKSVVFQNSSLNSEIYRTDSYQLLLPNKGRSFKILQKIHEASPTLDVNTPMDNSGIFVPNDAQTVNRKSVVDKNNSNVHSNTDVGNSSSISLPLSPELSIVENLSISKNIISNAGYYSLNDIEGDEHIENRKTISNFMISEMDVSMPLMEQDYGLEVSTNKMVTSDIHTNSFKVPTLSESILNKVNSVKVDEPSVLSDSLNKRLRDLLLESAKKISMDSRNAQKELEKNTDIVNPIKKIASKKRCSTPRKKSNVKKVKHPKITVESVVEEEHVESCSYNGRRSCPPDIQRAYYLSGNYLDVENPVDMYDVVIENTGKRKKDIIKVKILRPKKKIKSDITEEKSKTPTLDTNDESGIFIQSIHDSVELIHNHSETCLQANECIENSVEFIENNSESVISVDSNSIPDSKDGDDNNLHAMFTQDMFSTDAQDTSKFDKNVHSELLSQGTVSNGSYHTPMNESSLITEDLSGDLPDPPPLSTWHLFSEEESNANFPNSNTNTVGIGANLNHIFPITCAIPNLSTITETSKDDDSRKPTLEDFV